MNSNINEDNLRRLGADESSAVHRRENILDHNENARDFHQWQRTISLVKEREARELFVGGKVGGPLDFQDNGVEYDEDRARDIFQSVQQMRRDNRAGALCHFAIGNERLAAMD